VMEKIPLKYKRQTQAPGSLVLHGELFDRLNFLLVFPSSPC